MVFLILGCYVVDLEICILDDDYIFWMDTLCILFSLMKDIKALSLFWLIGLFMFTQGML